MKRPMICMTLASLVLMSCQGPAATRPAGGAGGKVAGGLGDAELRDVLAGMARSHEQKTLLALYEVLPWNTTDAPVHAFFVNMGKSQADLLEDLRTWAAAHEVDLAYHAGTDTMGKGQEIVEARQEKIVRGSNRTDFQRITLIQMYTDYEWQASQIMALLPAVKDEGLRAYLIKSQKVHEAGSLEILGLLKRYRFVP